MDTPTDLYLRAQDVDTEQRLAESDDELLLPVVSPDSSSSIRTLGAHTHTMPIA